VAADEVHLVFEGSVGANDFFGGFVAELGDEGPVTGAGGVGEERLESGGDSAFVQGVLVLEFLEGGVVLVEEFFVGVFGRLWSSRWFAGGLGHFDMNCAGGQEEGKVRVVFTASNQSWRTDMAEKVKIWFDKEGDFLEVLFSEKPGYMRETANDAVMERVDESGSLLGFSIMNVSRLAGAGPLSAKLSGRKPAA